MVHNKLLILLIMSLVVAGCTQQPAANIDVASPEQQTVQPTVQPTLQPTATSSGQTNTSELVTLVYQPMQCQKTPWETWYELGEVNFIKPPTDAEVITAYYSSQSIEIKDPKKVDLDIMVCSACDTCPTTYNFELKTAKSNLNTLKATGWEQRSDPDPMSPSL